MKHPVPAFDRLEERRSLRGPACLSHAALDRVALGEADPAERAASQAHLESCARCSATAASLERERASFVGQDLGALAADALARAGRAAPARGRFWQWLAPVALVAAAGLFLVARPRPPFTPPDARSTKGAFALSVFALATDGSGVVAKDAVGDLHLGQPLRPGDRIRLKIASAEPGYLLVLGVDTAARVSTYHADGPRAAPLTAVTRAADGALLPRAIELDATLGKETLIALRCPEPLPVATAVAAIEAAARQTAGTGTLPGRVDLPCAETRYVFEKVAR